MKIAVVFFKQSLSYGDMFDIEKLSISDIYRTIAVLRHLLWELTYL